MHAGKRVFAQIMECAPWHTVRRLIAKYRGDFNIRTFSCLDQFLCMAFAPLTYRESLRDIDACLRAQPTKLFHLGLHGKVSRSARADANESRDWRIHCEFAHALLRIARALYAKEPLGVELNEPVYALDATTIDWCLALFPWASFRATKAAVNLHTLLNLRGAIPAFVHISDGTLHDVNVLDLLIPEPGAFYVMDRGYLDVERLYRLHQAGSFFVTRAKSNFTCTRRYSRPVDRHTGLLCDQDVALTVFSSQQRYPARVRRIRYRDAEGRSLVFLTNHMTLPRIDGVRAVSPALTSRTVLHVEQGALAHQTLLRHVRERSENTSLDRSVRVRARARGHHSKPTGSQYVFALDATDLERHPMRKRVAPAVAYRHRTTHRSVSRCEPTDFAMSSVGH